MKCFDNVLISGEGQFLLVTAVNLSCEEERMGRKRVFDAAIPPFVRMYLEANDVNHFTYSKPFKGECVAAGEVQDPQVSKRKKENTNNL